VIIATAIIRWQTVFLHIAGSFVQASTADLRDFLNRAGFPQVLGYAANGMVAEQHGILPQPLRV